MASNSDIALVIGIDGYATSPLPSCVADAEEMASLLERNRDNLDPDACSSNFSVDPYVFRSGDTLWTRQKFLTVLSARLEAAGRNDFLLYFSGHGSTNDWGTDLVIADNDTVNMQEVLELVHRSAVKQAVLILDCCYSGSYGLMPTLGVEPYPSVSLIREGVTLLAASKATETAAAGAIFSAFTELLIAGLKGGAANHRGEINAAALFGYAAPAFGPLQQRPVFKASISEEFILRRVLPEVDAGAIGRLHQHFAPGQDSLVLSGAEGPGNQLYDDLLKLREGGLVRCPDDRHLSEHVAAKSEVDLSAAGLRLRLLAARGKA